LANGTNLQANADLQAGRKGRAPKIRVNPDPGAHSAVWPGSAVAVFKPLSKDMSLNNVSPGKNLPDTFNVVIEIPMNSDPIKYEVDKESGAIFVDRFMTTAMHYPTNYGYVPQTLSGDGDPVDVLVITPYPLHPGVVVPCRPLGILMMEDEAGVDGKVIAVPTSKILPMYDHWKTIDDVNAMRRNAIAHFFEHYKDLEKGKWVKVLGWEGIDAAKKEVSDGAEAYQKAQA
jgi:inorganic pyrophosphatase